MIPLKIIYAEGKTAAFTIASELYYIKTGPDFPEIYDSKLKKQIIPNADYWLQAQTQQRYSFRGLCDMIDAFIDGVHHSYNFQDIQKIGGYVYDKTIAYAFRTNYTRSFAQLYWIEILDEHRIKGLVSKIKDDFDRFKTKYKPDQFYDYLCRLWQFYNFHIPGESVVIEKLINKLGKIPAEPQYPIMDLENEIKEHVITRDLTIILDKFKGVDQKIKKNVIAIQTGKLQRPK
jgi:hypothetical protein